MKTLLTILLLANMAQAQITFGYDTVGGSVTPLNDRTIAPVDSAYTASTGDVVDTIYFYVETGSEGATVGVGIYTVETGTVTDLVDSAEVVIAPAFGPAWVGVDVNIPLVQGTEYTMAFGNANSDSTIVNFNTLSGTNNSKDVGSYFDDPFVETENSATQYSIYMIITQASAKTDWKIYTGE